MFEDLGSILGTTVLVTGVAASLGTVIINGVKTIPARGIAFTKQRYGYSITFDSDNFNAYHNINKWILSLNKRVLDNHVNLKIAYEIGIETQYNSLDYGIYTIYYKNCMVTINKSKNNKSGENDSSKSTYILDIITINIFGVNARYLRDEIIEYANRKDIFIDPNKLNVYNLGNGYNIRKYMVDKRDFSSIYTPYRDEIINYLEKWKSNKSIYDKKHLTYKIGILLYGKPGTGKSTLAKAIASYMNFNLYIVGKSSCIDSLLQEIKPNSIVLLEDIDCHEGVSKRKKTKEEIDESNNSFLLTPQNILGELLNSIDGIISPNNVIFIATTNHKEDLDDALIRKGRFDLQLNIDDLNREQALEMCSSFGFGEEVLEDEILPINPSTLQEKLLRLI